MHRFFISEQDHIDENQALIGSDDLIHQFTKVLRFKTNEHVVLLDNSGFEFEVQLGKEVLESRTKQITATVIEKRACGTELPVRVTLAVAILKNPEKMEWILQKGTELGVSEFVPLVTQRTERKVLFKVDRLQRILKEAAEQSGRGILPELRDPCKLEKVFEKANRIFVVPQPGVEMPLKNLQRGFANGVEEIVICIGPEGGFSEEELALFKGKGAMLVNLGPRILRAETAAIVSAALISGLVEA